MRAIDRLTTERLAIPSITLMEAAAEAAAIEIASRFAKNLEGKSVLVLCGPGNNGGDGASLARKLSLMGAHVDLALFGHFENTKGDARTNFEIVRGIVGSSNVGESKSTGHVDVELFTPFSNSAGSLSFYECNSEDEMQEFISLNHDIYVDALFGTGLTRPLSGIHLEGARYLQSLYEARTKRPGDADYLIVALDIPSGLNADLAEPIGEAVHADLTVTFTAPKPANVLPPASEFCGELVVADIGSPRNLIVESPSKLFLIEADDARNWLVRTRYAPDSYKNMHGHALVIGGSRGMTGAPALTANAAMIAGAGLVTIATPSSAQTMVAAHAMPEVMTAALVETGKGAVSFDAYDQIKKLAERAGVLAIGPGLTAEDESTRNVVRALVEERTTPVVIDADGLNSLAPWPDDLRGSIELPLILTPHQGEMLRLLGTNDKEALLDRVTAARDFATKFQLILVLKGTRTLTASPDGRVFVNPTGNAGLGTAGAGDTLTGVITGFVAQEFGTMRDERDALMAVVAAIYTSGMAGDLAAREQGMRAMVASDIRRHLSAAIRALDPEGEMP